MVKSNLHTVLTFILFFTLFFSLNVKADDEMFIGNWQGFISVQEQKLNISVTFEQVGSELKGTIDIPQQNLVDYPLDIREVNDNKIVFAMNNIPGDPVFEGTLNNNNITGTFKQSNNKLQFNLSRAQKSEDKNNEINLKGSEREIAIPVEGGNIYGSLTYPKVHDINDPIAIIVAGSGPTNRNGNTPLIEQKINNLKDIAHYLANNGILSIRYDKRGVGKSSYLVDSKTPTFGQYREDILQVIEYIKSNLGREADQIFLIGHSEGATLSIMAAQKVNDLAGLILLAGPGYKQETLLRNQLKRQNKMLYENDKIDSEDILVKALDDLIKAIQNNKKFNIDDYNIPDDFKNIYLSLNNQREFSSQWLKTDPANLLSKVNIPTCIIQGSNDQQVSEEDAKRLSKAVDDEIETYKYMEGINHLLFKDKHQVDEEILDTIVNFIKQYE